MRWSSKEADLALQGAALAHGIAGSQAFIDGIKRLALVSMLTLEVNGYQVNATDPELADWIIGLSAGTTPAELGSRNVSSSGTVHPNSPSLSATKPSTETLVE